MDIPEIAIIYKFLIGDYWYVGSTTESIKERMRHHKEASVKHPEWKLYKYIHENGGWDVVHVELVEFWKHDIRTEVWEKENLYIKLDDPFCLNTRSAKMCYEKAAKRNNDARRIKYAKRKEDAEAYKVYLAEARKANQVSRDRKKIAKSPESAIPAK
jgi:hypothetical protein